VDRPARAFPNPATVAVTILGIAGIVTIWTIGGVAGLFYLGAFLLLCLPGLPLGFALYGRRHIEGWLAGILLGYATTTVAWWAVIYSGRASTVALVISWAGATVLAWIATRLLFPQIGPTPVSTSREVASLASVLCLVPVLVAPPFARLGSTDASGGQQYRAYFIADFVWHTALTAELAREDPRPRNPYLASEPLHYYWTYFRVPATVVAHTGMDTQQVLKLNAFMTGLLLLAAIYVAALAALPQWPVISAIGVGLTVVAPSLEGWAGIADVVRRGLPFSELRDLNIDALAAWAFKSLRVDNLPRTLWYTPQHGFSCALGLLAVSVALKSGVTARPQAIVLAGCVLGASLTFSPLLGAAFCIVYAASLTWAAVVSRRSITALLPHTLAAAPVAAAIGWCLLNEVGEGAGSALQFGFDGLARNAPVTGFLLQFGPLLLPMAVCLWRVQGGILGCVWPALIGVVVAVLMMHLLSLSVDLAWVGFRAGNLFFALAPALVASGLARVWSRSRRLAAGFALLVLVAGLPTTVIDAFNTQDVENRGLSRDAERVRGTPVTFDRNQEFHWTVVVTAAQREALNWVREHTPADAVVQAEPVVRGRETWSLIPTFAERRMATGLPIPLLARPVYAERNARVRHIYATADARDAWLEGRALGIDYLYVDDMERSEYPAVSKFDSSAEYFRPVFQNAGASVYALRP
jgi:hypothetical protein